VDLIARFQQYADAFEEVFESDDWSLLEPYFTENAVYEIHAAPPFGARNEGREKVFAALKASLDGNDRRFDSRDLEITEGPELRDGAVWFRWRVRYGRAGTPGMVMEGIETARFEGDRIALLEDTFTEESQAGVLEFLGAHGDRLKPV
jgi:hypothetical protein